MTNTDQYNGNKIYMRNGEITSYTARKKIIKCEGFDNLTQTNVRLSLSQMFATNDWKDYVNPNFIYWDSTDTLYTLNVNFHDTSLISTGILDNTEIPTYFDKVSGSNNSGGLTPTQLAQLNQASADNTAQQSSIVSLENGQLQTNQSVTNLTQELELIKEVRILTNLTGVITQTVLDSLVLPTNYLGIVNILNPNTGELWRRIPPNSTWDKINEKLGFPRYIGLPITCEFGTMASGSVYPSFGTDNYVTLPIEERFSLDPFKAKYKPIEIQARLVNSNATPMTFEFEINGALIPAINIIYSPTLITYPIPLINQIPTSTAKTQIGILGSHINKALESYLIYEFVEL